MLKKFLVEFLHIAYYYSGHAHESFFLTAVLIVLMGYLFGEKIMKRQGHTYYQWAEGSWKMNFARLVALDIAI